MVMVEQDLLISRAIADIFSHGGLKQSLAFRGGTALHKLFLETPRRYSEDIDLVQVNTGPIGPVCERFLIVPTGLPVSHSATAAVPKSVPESQSRARSARPPRPTDETRSDSLRTSKIRTNVKSAFDGS